MNTSSNVCQFCGVERAPRDFATIKAPSSYSGGGRLAWRVCAKCWGPLGRLIKHIQKNDIMSSLEADHMDFMETRRLEPPTREDGEAVKRLAEEISGAIKEMLYSDGVARVVQPPVKVS